MIRIKIHKESEWIEFIDFGVDTEPEKGRAMQSGAGKMCGMYR